MAVPGSLEGAKGVLEKIPGSMPILVRILVPGVFALLVLWPVSAVRLPHRELSSTEVAAYLATAVVIAFFVGGIVSMLLGAKIYEIYEGRSAWPSALLDWAVRRQTARVESLTKASQAARDNLAYNEIWTKLQSYPLRAPSEPWAPRPTLLGNILYAYEDYPRSRYGMDSVFYWPRIWLALDKDKKEEIDSAWAVADGLLSLSAISVCAAAVWLAAVTAFGVLRGLEAFGWVGSVDIPGVRLPFGSPWLTALGGPALLLAAYAWYRLSLPFHRQNGEVYKAIFDVYRDKVSAMTRVGDRERTTWQGTSNYLQWLWVRCAQCGEFYEATKERCPKCSFLKSLSLDALARPPAAPEPKPGA